MTAGNERQALRELAASVAGYVDACELVELCQFAGIDTDKLTSAEERRLSNAKTRISEVLHRLGGRQ